MGTVGCLFNFEFSMVVLGVGRCPTGFVAPSRSKTLDFQPVKSDMGAVSIDVHDFRIFQQSDNDSLALYLTCFRPGAPEK